MPHIHMDNGPNECSKKLFGRCWADFVGMDL